MHRFPVGWAICLFAVAMAVIGYLAYQEQEFARLNRLLHVAEAPSKIFARLLIRYPRPPIFEEEYRMQDIEGVSAFQYRVRGYDGKQITVTAPPAAVYDVSFFFGKLDQDGIWQLVDKPARPGADAAYTISVKQIVDYKHGERTVTFTDPRYWATTAGRQYEIDLSKNKPSDLLTLRSTSLADPRYQTVVDDFRAFGPDEFKQNIARAQARIRAGR